MSNTLRELYAQWWNLRDDLRSVSEIMPRQRIILRMRHIENQILSAGGELP